MISFLKGLCVCLAVLAVGTVQIFGIHAGYLCDCTGQRSLEETCDAEDCHPSLAHSQDGKDAVQPTAPGDPGEKSPLPIEDTPKHSEVREALKMTGLPPVLALPPVVFFELPATLHVPDSLTPFRLLRGREHAKPPWDGSPPMPLLVARTMVMLV